MFDKQQALNQEALAQQSQAIKVFPNPVTDQFNIINTNARVQYNIARIINNTGQAVHIENMSNLDQVQIDASNFPGGMYIIEIEDNNGNKTVEKFMKMN